MALRTEFLTLSKAARPKILELARRKRLVRASFNEFFNAVYKGAPPNQKRELRRAFFAGAAELLAMQMYAADHETDDATEDDLELFNNIAEEVHTFYEDVMAEAELRRRPDRTN